MEKIKVAGYTKLAKWWERHRETAVPYHEQYYRDMLGDSDVFEYVGAYVDITGNKEIYKRKEMLRLITDCIDGKVDCIMAMTKGYLAANMRDFSYLFKYLGDARDWQIDFMTQDENDASDTSGFYIDTIKNEENQKEALRDMVEQFVSLYPEKYEEWKVKLEKAMQKLDKEQFGNE